MSVGISETESGIDVKGLHRESFSFEGEVDVRRLLADACDNRCSHTLPVGGSIGMKFILKTIKFINMFFFVF